MTLTKALFVAVTLGVTLIALASMNVAFSNPLIEGYTPFGDPVYVTDDIDTMGREPASTVNTVKTGEPDGLGDYDGDYRWPEPSLEPGDRDIVQSEPGGTN